MEINQYYLRGILALVRIICNLLHDDSLMLLSDMMIDRDLRVMLYDHSGGTHL